MKCYLEIYSPAPDNVHEVENPSPEQIEKAVDDLLPIIDYTVAIRNDSEKKDRVRYVSMPHYDDEKISSYMIEYNYFPKKIKSYLFFQMTTTDIKLVKRLFRMYALGEIPDVSEWSRLQKKHQR